jgi:hypothetical protein
MTASFLVLLLFGCGEDSLPPISSSGFDGPRLTVVEPEFDFGYVPQNSKISHTFWLRSTGSTNLSIEKVVSGCGCVTFQLGKTEIAPGDSTALEVFLMTKRYRNGINKNPRIETNEDESIHRVHIFANVVPRPDSTYPIVFKPYKFDISQFGSKIRDEMKFSIINVSNQHLRLELVDRPKKLFDFQLPKLIEAHATWTGLLKLHPKAIPMSFEKSITVRLLDENRTRFTIPVKRTKRDVGL